MAKGVVRKVAEARNRVAESIRRDRDASSVFSRGLAGEGYQGGYLAALDDVLLALRGVEPRSEYWEASDQ